MTTPMRRFLIAGFLLAFCISSAAGALVVYLLIQSNNQGEAYNTITGVYDVPYLAEIFAIVFVEGILFSATIAALAYGGWRMARWALRR